jgi:YD repeat-containing protein
MKRLVIVLCLSVVLSVFFVIPAFTVCAQSVVEKTPVAQGPLKQINEYFSTQTTTYSDGTILSRDIISGPPKPPPGYELERSAVALPEPDKMMATGTLTVPAFNWVFGCSSVSGAMIAGYYDRNGFPNMYTGPTNGGVMPLDNSSWPTWSDGYTTYPNLPLAGSRNGVDGRTTRGSIDDYWIQYGSSASDPYITGSWTQHTWSDAIGDYMKTSQSAYSNIDGSTTFYNYTSSASQLLCSEMPGYGIHTLDGTYGRKLFYEARGYTVTTCYSQRTDNLVTGGFSFAQYKAEIDAGRPVMLNLAGHTIVGVGYDDSGNTVYIHDTWDYSNHTMTWGGSYSGMALQSVSIVNLQAPPSTVKNDFNADGKSDLLWRNPTTGENVVYYMNGATILSGAYLPTIDSAWTLAGTADLNADGKPDLLWRNPTTGQNVVYYMNGITIQSGAYLPTIDSAWTLAGAADFNADLQPDLLWRNPTTGQNVIYYMNGITIQSGAYLQTVDPAWTLAGTADLNADGKPDLIWRNPATGENVVYYMNGITIQSSYQLFTVPGPWVLSGK